MTHRHIGIYVASKLRHASKVMQWRLDYPDLHFTARWPIVAGLGSEDQRPVYQWMKEAEVEIINSDAMVVYAEAGEMLKTALLHVGIAYVRRIPIWVIGEHPSYAEWQFCEGVMHRSPSIEKAITGIKIYFRGEQPIIGRGTKAIWP